MSVSKWPQKNISIKQIELRGLEAEIDKNDAKGNFLPSINAQANHSWNIGLNQDITRGTLENRTTQYTSMGANLSIDVTGIKKFKPNASS